MELKRATVPAHPDRPASPRALPLLPELMGHETVLIMLDEVRPRRVLARALDRFGYAVLQAPDTAQAQHIARLNQQIQVLLIDLITSEMTGAQLALWFRAEFPSMQVVVASTSLTDLHSLLGRSQQITLLAKPYTPLDVIRLFRRVLPPSPEKKPRS